VVSFTDEGRERFDEMARAHRKWVEELFEGLVEEEREMLSTLLSAARRSVQDRT
jgi:DNA-binding MarR family transcriptional regulator